MNDFEKTPEVRGRASDSSTGIMFAIAAAVVLVAALFFFNGGFNMTPKNTDVVQNNTALPAPVIETPVTPQVTTPPVPKPTTPSGDAPAANP